MNRLSKEKLQQIVAVIVIGLVLVGVIYWYGVRAQFRAIESNRSEAVEMEGKVATANRLLKEADQAKADLTQVQGDLDNIESGMAQGDLYFWIINTMRSFAAGQKVDISTFSREQSTPVGIYPEFPYNAVRYSIRGSGYYHDIGKFVADFENAFPYMRLENIDLAPADSSLAGDREKLAFRADVVALLKPLPLAPAPVKK